MGKYKVKVLVKDSAAVDERTIEGDRVIVHEGVVHINNGSGAQNDVAFAAPVARVVSVERIET